MTRKIISVAALCTIMGAGVSAEETMDQGRGTYVGNIAPQLTIAHQAQLVSKATEVSWAPETFAVIGVVQPVEHQAQLIASSTQVSWVEATYSAKTPMVTSTLPLQHQAQLTGLMTRYEWSASAALLNN